MYVYLRRCTGVCIYTHKLLSPFRGNSPRVPPTGGAPSDLRSVCVSRGKLSIRLEARKLPRIWSQLGGLYGERTFSRHAVCSDCYSCFPRHSWKVLTSTKHKLCLLPSRPYVNRLPHQTQPSTAPVRNRTDSRQGPSMDRLIPFRPDNQ